MRSSTVFSLSPDIPRNCIQVEASNRAGRPFEQIRGRFGARKKAANGRRKGSSGRKPKPWPRATVVVDAGSRRPK